MIKIECDHVLFGDGSREVKGSIEVKGPANNIKYEIYTILKKFEEQCPNPYADALEMIYTEAGI